MTFTGRSNLQGSAWTDDNGEVALTGPEGAYIVTIPGFTLYTPYATNPPNMQYAVDLYPGNNTSPDEYVIVDSNVPCP